MANSLKDMLSSVDWGKMMSGADARNALIGTALGGALLGGAGLARKRDPEESKLAPVGDALTGALLGGVAGYALPKGLALFRDSGGLAPDGDTLRTNYLGWGAGGAVAGTGVFGGSLYKTLSNAKAALRGEADRQRAAMIRDAAADVAMAQRAGADASWVRHLENRGKMLQTGVAETAERERILASLRRRKWGALFRGDMRAYREARGTLADLVGYRNMGSRGYNRFSDLLNRVADGVGSPKGEPQSLLKSLLRGNWRKSVEGSFATHGKNYAPKSLFGLLTKIPMGRGKSIPLTSPLARVIRRGGKYALGGTALALLAHKLLGPSASNNYKN